MVRFAVALLVLLVFAPNANAQTTPPPPEHRADPTLTTYVQRSGPYKITAYQTFIKSVQVKPPPVAGAIVGMDVHLVDPSGAVIPQYLTMLHHVVFTNGGPDDRKRDPQCPGKTTRERFFGTSEELRPLTLPPGYGYPTAPNDVWHSALMVMNHTADEREFFLEYRMTIDPRPVTPVKPYWLSVVPCSPDPQWTVPGTSKGEHRKSREFVMPEAGRIVAVGAHLHGGANSLILSQPACGHRTLVQSMPSYAPADDPLYKVRPLLHEPDPKSISWWQSSTGLAIDKGATLKVTAAYDGTREHTRVMGIDHIYVAPPASAAPVGCAPLPPDAQILGPEFAGARPTPPAVDLTLSHIGADGIARPTLNVPGRNRKEPGNVHVRVSDFSFGPSNITVGRGATVIWKFPDSVTHDVTVARGPVAFASPWRRNDGVFSEKFTQPGTYYLHCSLHSAYMSQKITVTRSRPRPRDADRPHR
jgi:plastocyanin